MALAAAAVMSCSESEEIENAGQKAEIKLGTVVGNTTRATVTDLPELQKVGFTVYAYNTGATAMASVATFDAMKEFMTDVKVNAARKSKVDDNTARMQSIKQLGV